MSHLRPESLSQNRSEVMVLLPEEPTAGRVFRLRRLIASQRSNLQNFSVLVLINFTTAAIGFLTTVKIANTLGKETFGLLAYGLAVSAYSGAFIRFGQDRTLVRDMIHHPEQAGTLVAASLLLRWILVGAVVISLLLWKLAAGPSSDLTWSLLIVIIANSLVSMDLQPVYDSWHRMSRHAVYNLIQRSLYFLILWAILLWAPERLNIFWIGTALFISVILYLFLQHRWAIRRIDMRGCRLSAVRMAGRMVRVNSMILVAALGCLSFGSLNQLILKHYCGTAELGGYAAAWQIACIATLLLSQLSRLGNPAMARITRQETPRSVKIRFLVKYSLVMLLAVVPIAALSMAFPERILAGLFKPEFVTAASSLRIFGSYVTVFSLGIVASQYVISSGLEWLYLGCVLTGTLFSFALSFILVRNLGGTGAALSLLTAHGVAMGMYWVIAIRHVRKAPDA